MANRTFQDKLWTLQKGLVLLKPVFSVGALGAVTLKKLQFSQPGTSGVTASVSYIDAPTSGNGYAVGDGIGTRAVSRTGTGAWTITLSDSYVILYGVQILMLQRASAGAVVVGVEALTTGNVATNTATGNGGTIDLVFVDESGAADPASSTTVTLGILLGNATEP